MTNIESDIDIVITWVDNHDPQWIASINTFSQMRSDPRRHEDLESLKYVFRGIEKNLSWARKIFLVTCNQVPTWLNTNHPKLTLISHDQILPSHCLPTFNAAAIEMGFINIPDLAEKFIYFNDDTIAINRCNPDDFFIDNLPVDSIKLRNVKYDGTFSHLLHTVMGTFNDDIGDKRKYILKNLNKYIHWKYSLTQNIQNLLFLMLGTFDMFSVQHLAQPHLLSNWKYFYKKYPSCAEQTMKNRFRSFNDHNQYIFKFLSYSHGRFSPSRFNESSYCHVKSIKDLDSRLNSLSEHKTICINEDSNFNINEYNDLRKTINIFLQSKLPEPSDFEIMQDKPSNLSDQNKL